MGDNSTDTMGDNSRDTMDVSAGEETETEYFQDVANFDDSYDHSMDSLQGSLKLPMFSLEQSSGLHGSQGFQISTMQNDQVAGKSSTSDELKVNYVTDRQPAFVHGENIQNVVHPAFRADGGLTTFNIVSFPTATGTGVTDKSPYFNQGNFNIVSVSGSSIVSQASVFSGGLSYTFGGERLSSIIQSKDTSSGDVGMEAGDKTKTPEAGDTGGTSSDEKSGQYKTSPKGKGRKSRSTSSNSNEMTPKQEVQSGSLQAKIEPTEPGSGEMAFKPSLLDEILTEKKLALMRSPEVIRFLQSQQENLAREKAMTLKQDMDS